MTSVNDPSERLKGTLGEPDFQKLIASNLCTVHELFVQVRGWDNPRDLQPEWRKSELREFLNPQRQRVGDTDTVLTV
jgi:hypothetical protein